MKFVTVVLLTLLFVGNQPLFGVNRTYPEREFEGDLNDSSGHGLNMSSGSVTYSTAPVSPPTCNAGAQQTFRAGFSGQLDGSASRPLDGGSALSYLWQRLSGPTRVVFSDRTSARPSVRGMVFGTYVFQLTVTDGSGQSSVCSVRDGAAATDDHGVVITGNANVDLLLGPMARFGANPWPWFDDRNKKLADLQIASMDANFPDYWNVPAGPPGSTVAVTHGSQVVR